MVHGKSVPLTAEESEAAVARARYRAFNSRQRRQLRQQQQQRLCALQSAPPDDLMEGLIAGVQWADELPAIPVSDAETQTAVLPSVEVAVGGGPPQPAAIDRATSVEEEGLYPILLPPPGLSIQDIVATVLRRPSGTLSQSLVDLEEGRSTQLTDAERTVLRTIVVTVIAASRAALLHTDAEVAQLRSSPAENRRQDMAGIIARLREAVEVIEVNSVDDDDPYQ